MKIQYRLTRGEAIDVGLLVDVSATARKLGIKYPVAVTETVYGNYIMRPPDEEKAERQALFDFLWKFALVYERQPVFWICGYQICWESKGKPIWLGLQAYQEQNHDGMTELTIACSAKDRARCFVSDDAKTENKNSRAFCVADEQESLVPF